MASKALILPPKTKVIVASKTKTMSQPKHPKKQQNQSHGGKGSGVESGAKGLMSQAVYPKTYFDVGSGGKTVVRGCECVGELSTSPVFQAQARQFINPGNFLLFPRLSQVAYAYEQFKFRKLKFYYVRGCPETTVGAVVTFIDYDPIDAMPPSMVQALANQSSQPSSVAESHWVKFDCGKNANLKYFVTPNCVTAATASTVSVAELRQDYEGIVTIATDKGASTNAFAGYFFVEYECDVFTPKPAVPIAICAEATTTTLTDVGKIPASGTQGVPLQKIDSQSGIQPRSEALTTTAYDGIQGAADAAKAIYEAGSWLVDWYAYFTSATVDEDKSDADSDFGPCKGNETKKAPDHWKQGASFNAGRFARLHGVNSDGFPKKGIPCPDGSMFVPNASSGDVTMMVNVFDVTAPNPIDPNFPVTTANMVSVGSSSFGTAYSGGTASAVYSTAGPVTVPTGSQYMFQPWIGLGPTTGRSLNNAQYAVNAKTESGI